MDKLCSCKVNRPGCNISRHSEKKRRGHKSASNNIVSFFSKLYRCSFLELGGNSVAAVNASSVLQKEGFDIPVTEFFTNRPLSEMINAVEENENQSLLVPDISMISFYKYNLNTCVTNILTIA